MQIKTLFLIVDDDEEQGRGGLSLRTDAVAGVEVIPTDAGPVVDFAFVGGR
jgi:hypothetical protein